MRARRAGVAIGGGCLAAAPLMVILWKRDSFLPALLLAVCGVLLLLF